MKIKFNDGREYDVFSVTHQMDEYDVPIDIVIYGTKEMHYADNVCEALYARLEPFTVRFADRVQYTEIVE